MKYILILSVFMVSQWSYGTGQVPDYLIYNGDTIAIFSNPLEKYFEQRGTRELKGFVGCGSTACWRGYQAIWELKGDSLYLIKITSCNTSCGLEIHDANLKAMFGTDMVFAHWFSGKIIAPQGEIVQYIHMGYASIYEKEQHITFKNGKRIREKTISNEKIANKIRFQKRQGEIAIKLQDTLFKQVKKHMVWDTIHTPFYELCDEKYILTYNKKGKLKSVWVDWEGETFREKIDDWWWNITDDLKCRKTIKKVLKSINISYLDLPKQPLKIPFDIFYRKETGELELWKDMWMEE